MKSRFITIDGIRAHYVVAGEGPPLVLVPGLASSVAAAWQRVIEPLARHFTVHALDLPGNGDSDRPDVAYSYEEGIDFLLRYLDAHGLQRVNLLGSSAGGLMSTVLALRHPERVERLVLVASAGFGRNINWVLRLLTLPILGELLTAPHPLLLRIAMRGVYADAAARDERLVREFQRVRRMPGTSRALLRALRSHLGLAGLKRELVLLDRLSELRPPTLLIWGARDAVVPLEHAHAAAARIPQCQLEIFPDCGHDPAWEHPERFQQVVRQFILEPALRTVG